MNKLSKWKKLEYAAIGFLLLCLVFLSFCFYKPEPAVNAPVSVVSDWYRLQDGQRIEVRLPANLTPGPDGSLTLYCDKLTRSDAGKFFPPAASSMALRSAWETPFFISTGKMRF